MAIAGLVLVWPGEAHLSGSSTVISDSKYFRAEIESVRKIVENPEDETLWHEDWRKENQPRVERVRQRIEKTLPSLASRYSLVPYRADLVVVHDGEDDDLKRINPDKPFQYRYRYDFYIIYVAWAKLPAPEVRRALKQELSRIPHD